MSKSNPPDTIYLQWHGDNVYGDLDNGEPGEVTWSADKVNDSDIRYIRATSIRDSAEKLLEACKKSMRSHFNLVDAGLLPTTDYDAEATKIANELHQIITVAIRDEE